MTNCCHELPEKAAEKGFLEKSGNPENASSSQGGYSNSDQSCWILAKIITVITLISIKVLIIFLSYS